MLKNDISFKTSNINKIEVGMEVSYIQVISDANIKAYAELSGDNNTILPTRVEAIASAASSFYSGFKLTSEEKQSATSGLRPVSPDGLPFIGKSSKFKNLNVAAGHAMMGWSLGPITGKLMSEIVDTNHTSVLLEPFDLERF